MTLHPALLAEMLEDEVTVARRRLGDRISGLEVDGSDVFCHLSDTNVGDAVIRLAGRDYDAEPFSVAVVDAAGEVADPLRWPGNLCGGVHPGLGRPFVCVRGTLEYHTHTSHLGDPWELYRPGLRLPQLLDHLVRRARTS